MKLFLLILIFYSANTMAQVYKATSDYGTIHLIPVIDTTFKLTRVCGLPANGRKEWPNAAMLYDSCNKNVIIYILKEKRWLSLPIKNLD